jgi:cell division protease FtsH
MFWFVLGISALLLFQVIHPAPGKEPVPEISYSQFVSEAEAGSIASVNIEGGRIRGQYREGKGTFQLTGPSNPGLFLGVLRDNGVEIRFKDSASASVPLQLLGTWAPLILLAALWFFMIRQMQRRTNTPRSEGPRGSSAPLR